MEDDTRLLPSPSGLVSQNWMHDQHQYPRSHHGTPTTEYTGFVWPPVQASGNIDTFDNDGHVQRLNHQSLHPLVMPQWPSLLSSHSSQTTPVYYPVMPQSHPGTLTSTPLLPTISPESARVGSSTPRRTLTDDERRKMCEYHDKHPSAKQNEIGSLFGVERSTVSKVLRHKNKYLQKEDETLASPERRIKLRSPDVEKTLSNWVIREQQKGLTPSDEAIRTKAKYFSTVSGPPASSSSDTSSTISPTTSATWLKNFKRRHGICARNSSNGSKATNDHISTPVNRRPSDSKSNYDFTSPTTRSPLSAVEAAPTPSAPQPGQPLHIAHSIEDLAPVPSSPDNSSTAAFTDPQRRTPLSSNTTTNVSATPLTVTSDEQTSSPCYSSPHSHAFLSTSPFFHTPDSATATLTGFYHSPAHHNPHHPHHQMEIVQPSLDTYALPTNPHHPPPPHPDMDIDAPPSHLLPSPSSANEPSSPPQQRTPSQEEARRALEIVWRYFCVSRGSSEGRGLDMEETAMMGKFMEKLKEKKRAE